MFPVLLVLALSQIPADADYPGVEVDRALHANQYLRARDAAEEAMKTDTVGFLKDIFGLTQSYLSLEREALATLDSMHGTRSSARDTSLLDDAVAVDAIAAIVEAAKDRRVVILNESHHMPRHRAFATELLRELKKLGFDTFAAETFMDPEGTQERGWPDHETGYYTQDPVFGELVRVAIEEGFRLVKYETEKRLSPDTDPRERVNSREIDQANHLKERVFDPFPDARLFVYVGYSHATEDWRDEGGPNEIAWMAARLAKLTGFDPLTIDQTTATPRSDPKFEDPYWARAVKDGLLSDGPKLLRDDAGDPIFVGDYAGRIDLQVFHPPLREIDGRPDWLARGRKRLAPPPALVEVGAPDAELLLQAFFAGEDTARAIPADQFVVSDRAAPPVFLLRPGTYTLIAQDAEGSILATIEGVVVE
jgi:hypothetical protein